MAGPGWLGAFSVFDWVTGLECFVGGKAFGGGRGFSCVGSHRDEEGDWCAGASGPWDPARPLCSPRARAAGRAGPPASVPRGGPGSRSAAPARPPPRGRAPLSPAPSHASARRPRRARAYTREPRQHANEPAPVPRLKFPTAQWTTPAQTSCLQLCLGRKKNLWLYFLLFPGAAEAGHQGEPPPPIGLSSPPSLESGAAPPNQCRKPRWQHQWTAVAATIFC